MEEKRTYSISVRLRRTKVEYAFVSVPVDEQIWKQHPDDAQKSRINGEKVFEIAKRMGNDPSVLWAQESDPLMKSIRGRSLHLAPERRNREFD